jgi:hypothetical protein
MKMKDPAPPPSLEQPIAADANHLLIPHDPPVMSKPLTITVK